MANQQVKIDLLFQANTTAAQNNIQQLSNLLHQISTKTVIGVDGSSLSQAVQAAQQLQIYLQNAVNVNTGKLDLMQLRTDLKASGTDLQTLTNQLRAVGPIGEQAFLKVASAVSQAEVPMVRANGMVKNFMTTLANTAKWQIASSAIHGIVGAFNSATSHAKNLNKALTDIQIVTGYSTDYMSRFAESASKAAKELNTTTTEYAKAALIFYQQGLSGEAVAERAETVVKLAQVTGQTAQTVSDQMTAIWNNFHTGSQELEYYADVLTKLGAATAASTDEISDGLQKFAAIAKTVDLSYETAAAAVATVVDKTRQSADVVGTSFKTIFARMEGLSLGDTLEDGVDLNKYSEALEKVGVDVLNARGELRSMDAILDDLGSKWQGLGEKTQVALAQTVGGVRQYNQMMSLMNNWEDVKNNIELAKDATGELRVQQEIWAKSYEGSLERLNQAKNELYEEFISDEALIGFNDVLTKVIEGFTMFVENIGGLGPLITMLTLMFSKTLFPLMMTGFKRMGNMISVWTGKAARDVANMQGTISAELQQMANDGTITKGMREQLLLSDQLVRAKQQLMINSKNMSAAQRVEAESRLAVAESLMAETAALLEQQSALEKKAKAAKAAILGDMGTKKQLAANKVSADFRKTQQETGAELADTETILNDVQNYSVASLGGQKKLDTRRIEEARTKRSSAEASYQDAINREQDAQGEADKYQTELDRLNNFRNQANVRTKTMKGPGGKSGGIIGYEEQLADGSWQSVSLDELETRKASAQAGLTKAQNDVSIAQSDATQSKTEMETQQKIIEAGEKRVKQLETALELKKKINDATRDDATLESAIVSEDEDIGMVIGERAGEGDSARLHKRDQEVDQMQYDAETAQMDSISAQLSGSTVSGEGALQVEASIANYEKLYEAIGNQAVMHSKLEGAAKDVNVVMRELSKESANVAKTSKTLTKEQKANVKQLVASGKSLKGLSKDEKAYAKALKAQIKSQKESVKTLKNSRSEYIALAKQAKLSDNGVKELEHAFDQLGGTAEEQKAGLKTIEQTFKTLGIASDNVGMDLQLMADKMQAALIDAGLPADEVEKLTNSLKKLAQQAPLTAAAAGQTGSAINNITPSASSLLTSFGNIGTSTMTVVGNLMSLTTALDGIKVLFDDNATASEKFQGLLSAMMGILPTLIMLTSGLADALDKESASSIKAFIAKQKEILGSNMSTGAKWANTAANIANLLSNPFTMALAAIALVAIGAAVVGIIGLTKKTNENTAANYKLSESQEEVNQQTVDLAKKTVELADAWLEQMGVMDELIAKYNKLNDAEKQAAGSAEEILEAVPDLIDAYDDLAENVFKAGSEEEKQYQELRQQLEDAAAKGNVEEIEDITYEIDKLLAPKTAAATKAGVSAGTANVLSDFYDAGLKDVHGVDSSTANVSKKNIFVEDIETDSAIWGDLSKAGLTTTRKSDNYAGLALRTDTNEAFLHDYEAMKEVYENAIKDPSKATDEGVQAIKKILDATKDSYNELKELYDSEKVQNAAAESLKLGDLNDIDDYGDYTQHRFSLINNLMKNQKMSEEDATKYADQFLSENGATKDFNLMRKRVDALKNAGSDVREETIAGYTEEEQKLFLEIDINKYQTKTAVETAIDLAQAEADEKEITANMNIVTSMQDSLKEDGMTSTDWTAIRNSGYKWSDDEFDQFIDMGYDKQIKYLEKIKLRQQESLILSKEKANIEVEAGIKQLQFELNNHILSQEARNQKEAELQALLEQQQQITDELLIEKEVLENMQIEAVGLNADEVKTYAKHLREVSKNSDEVSIHLQENEEMATAVAKATMRMNRGVETLNENIMEWDDILKNSDKSSQEYCDALVNLRTAMSDILDVDEEFLSTEFLTNPDNLDLMKQAAEGSATAIDKLAKAAAKDILLHVEMPQDVKTQVARLHDDLVNNLPNLKIGATIDASAFQEILNTSKMTVEQAQAYFDSLGYEPTFAMVKQEMPLEGTKTTTTGVEIGEVNGYQYIKSATTTTEPITTGQTHEVMVPAVDSNGVPEIKTITKKSSGTMNNFSSANSGGSSAKVSKAEKIDRTKKSDIVERYKEVTDALDDVEDAMDDVSKAADRMYGVARLKQMEKSNKLIKEKINLLEQEKKEAQENLRIDRDALNVAALEAGVSFKLDENDNITNYTSEMTKLYNELAKREAIADSYAGGSEERQSEYIKNNVEPLQEKIDALKAAMAQYEETRELLEDVDNEIEEQWYEWQSNNAEQLSYKLELRLSINESELEEIDYYLGKMSDDFYKMAESAAYLAGGILSDGSKTDGQLGVFTNNLNSYMEAYEEATAAFNSYNPDKMDQRWLSEADYYASLEEMRSGIYDNLNSLLELDKTMSEYYGNTLAAAGEELAKFTTQMENQSAVLDHFSSIMIALGKETDYKRMGVILKGQSELLEDQYMVAKSNFEMLEQETVEKYNLWQEALQAEADAIALGDTASAKAAKAAAEFYSKEYEAALEASSEAQDQYLSLAANWADSLKAVLENSLADLDKTLEEALTGGTTFDKLTQSMERAQSLQEDYLTTTNKVYETNKLMQKVQQNIDKTTNSVAKKRMQQFIKETQQLQNQSKLSQFELDIQQAKYDLLLAEIALEEAQQAKSTVRLQRDTEGNFGYIYTADANAINNAEQQLADARNALYNIGLEGANNYAQKMIELEAQMYEELTALHEAWMNGEFESKEQYEEEVAKLEAHWKQKRIDYSNLYQVALTTDSAIVADAWSTDFVDMTISAEEWSQKVDEYVGNVVNAFSAWDNQMSIIVNDTLGQDLNTLKEKVGNITTASTELRDFITQPETGLLATFKKEFDSVTDSTTAYANLRSEIKKNINEYEKLGRVIGEALAAQKEYDSKTWHSLSIDGQKIGHYDSAEKAAEAAWGSYYINGTMSEKEAKNITIIDRYGNTTKVGDYWKSSWAKRPVSPPPSEEPKNNDTGDNSGGRDSDNGNKDDGNKNNDYDNGLKSDGTNTEEANLFSTVNGSLVHYTYNTKKNTFTPNYAHAPIDPDSISSEEWRLSGDYIIKKGYSNELSAVKASDYENIKGIEAILALIPKFDTGGYTGSWGTEGKLAMLHEKELILNADDTTNFLASLEVLREIINTINLHSMNAQLGGLLSSPYWTDSNRTQTLEQQVHIEANFPNVSDRNEIEEAFNNLVSKASQYVNRK